MTPLEKVVQIITQYEALSEDFSSPHFIQQLRDLLSAYSVHIGVLEAKYRAEANAAEYAYKVNRASKRILYRQSKLSIADAESNAEVDVKDLYERFIEDEHAYIQMRNVREQVNKTLDAMSSKLRIIMEDGKT